MEEKRREEKKRAIQAFSIATFILLLHDSSRNFRPMLVSVLDRFHNSNKFASGKTAVALGQEKTLMTYNTLVLILQFG